jgi:putative ABC transport system ATP-binding protein
MNRPSPTLPQQTSGWPRAQPFRLERVVVRRGAKTILDRLDLTFEPNRRYVVLGASGSGKSTLLRLLNRLEDPAEGRVLIGDVPLSSLPVRQVRRSVGLVFQNPRPLPGTIRENLVYSFMIRDARPPEPTVLAEALEELALDPARLDRDAELLSGGEKQRLAIAAALLAEPEILALDEPTAALDPRSARKVADALELRRRRQALRTIVVTHHREHALWLGETAVVLDRGVVVDLGPTAEVLARADAAIWAEMEESAP